MIGFTFRNKHSSLFKIGARSVDRSVIPAKRRKQFVIPGRDGTLDFGDDTYDNRPIVLQIGLVKNANFEELRQSARDIAQWLSGQGLLIFDDEKDKAYQAKLYEYVGIDQVETMAAGKLEIVFECQPFAESLEYRQVNEPNIVNNSHSINADVKGTSESCPIITIKNIGTNTIKNITILRKVGV